MQTFRELHYGHQTDSFIQTAEVSQSSLKKCTKIVGRHPEPACAFKCVKQAMKHCNLDFLVSSTVVKKNVAPDYWTIKSTQHFSISNNV
jgi:hypothetical protein